MTIQNVVLIGAGGNIGSHILAALTAANFNVTILSLASSKSSFPDHKVVTVADDYPHADLVAAFKGQDAVVSPVTITPGYQKIDGTGQYSFINAAIEAGVQRYIPSEFGHDHRNAASVELSELIAEKAKVFRYLESKQSQISWTIVPSGPFYDFDLKIGFCGINVKENKATVTAGGNTKYSCSTMPQVGDAVAAILKHDKETANQFVNLESFATTQNETLALVQKVTGKEFAVEHQSGEVLIEGSKAGIKAGNFFANYGLIQAADFIPGYGAEWSEEAAKWRQILGLKRLDHEAETARILKEIETQPGPGFSMSF